MSGCIARLRSWGSQVAQWLTRSVVSTVELSCREFNPATAHRPSQFFVETMLFKETPRPDFDGTQGFDNPRETHSQSVGWRTQLRCLTLSIDALQRRASLTTCERNRGAVVGVPRPRHTTVQFRIGTSNLCLSKRTGMRLVNNKNFVCSTTSVKIPNK